MNRLPLACAALATVLLGACSSGESTSAPAPVRVAEGAAATAPSGLIVEELAVGSGATALAGNRVSVHYTGWLTSGTQFDSSRDRNQPFEFQLGAGQVIPGWDEGVAGMRVGGKRKLTIPPQLGYGARGAGGVIPPDAVLVFEIELLDVR